MFFYSRLLFFLPRMPIIMTEKRNPNNQRQNHLHIVLVPHSFFCLNFIIYRFLFIYLRCGCCCYFLVFIDVFGFPFSFTYIPRVQCVLLRKNGLQIDGTLQNESTQHSCDRSWSSNCCVYLFTLSKHALYTLDTWCNWFCVNVVLWCYYWLN